MKVELVFLGRWFCFEGYVEYYNTQRPNTRFNGGCIIEDSTHWQSEGEIKKVSQLPGLLNYYYRERVGE